MDEQLELRLPEQRIYTREKPEVVGRLPSDVLTRRQVAVLMCMVNGMTTKQTADNLQLSVKTVETHRSGLMRRLGIFNVAGLTRYAIRHELIRP